MKSFYVYLCNAIAFVVSCSAQGVQGKFKLKLCAAAVCTAALPIWIGYANVMEAQLMAKCIIKLVAADDHWWKLCANGH